MRHSIAKLILGSLLLTLLVYSVAPAQQDMKKLAQTGFQFLKVDPSARAAAMGAAYVAVANDANSVFWNPAGMTAVQGLDFSLNQTSWLVDTDLISVAGVKQIGSWYVGLGFINMSYGNIPRTVVANNDAGYDEIGSYSPGGLAVGVSLARQFTNKFSVGMQLKYAYEDLGSNSVRRPGQTEVVDVDNTLGIVAFDIGTQYYTGFKDLRISMTIRNFSTEVEYEVEGFQLPLTFDLGVAMDVLSLGGDQANHRLTLAVDAIHPRDFNERMHLGAEYWFMDTVALRAGYKLNYDTEGYSAGAGLQRTLGSFNLRLDYSFSDAGSYLGSVHRVSFGGSF